MGLPMRVGFWAVKNNLTLDQKKNNLTKKTVKNKKTKIASTRVFAISQYKKYWAGWIRNSLRARTFQISDLRPLDWGMLLLLVYLLVLLEVHASVFESMLLYVHFCHWFWTMLLSCLISVACVGVYSSLPFASWTLFVLSSNLIQKKKSCCYCLFRIPRSEVSSRWLGEATPR